MSDAVPCSACQRGDPCAENERLLRAEVERLERNVRIEYVEGLEAKAEVERLKATLAVQGDALLERTAQLAAHRVCHAAEHDPKHGKLHGYCVVCGNPWPCQYAEEPPALRAEVARLQRDREEVVGALGKQAHPGLSPGENVAEVVAEVERLRKALEECSLNCEHLHHGKKDRHESGTPCPVEARVRAALEEKP